MNIWKLWQKAHNYKEIRHDIRKVGSNVLYVLELYVLELLKKILHKEVLAGNKMSIIIYDNLV